MDEWMQSHAERYGSSLNRSAPATSDATPLHTVAPVAQPALSGFATPSAPLFWFGLVAAGMVGALAYATGKVA
jgi:hypothetical protein